MLKKISLLFGAASAITLSALPPGVAVDENGAMKLGGLNGAVQVYDKDWRVSIQKPGNIVPEPSYPVPSEKIYELKGILQIPGSSGFTIQQWVKELSPDTASYSMTLKNPEGIRCNLASYAVTLPAHAFDGKEIKLNGKPVKVATNKVVYGVKEIEIVNDDRKILIKGNFPVEIQDHRNYSVPNFSVRLLFSPSGGVIKDARLEFMVTVTPLATAELDLGKADSGKTTGDAMANELRRRGSNGGNVTVGNIRFSLGDVKKKQGALLRLAPGASAEIAAPEEGGSQLYLLHNTDSAGAKPEVTAIFAGGEKKSFILTAGKEFGIEKPLKRLPNGALAASNNESFEGLYFSHFPLGGKAEKLIFTNRGEGEWIIAGATLAEGVTPAAQVESIHYTDEDGEWAVMEPVKPVVKGSVLDFSYMTDVPAGKNGWIKTTEEGHFVAEKAPGKRFRFLGPNLCFSAQYLDKATAEKLADEFAALGFNSVRFHHYDNLLADPKGNDSTVFLPERIDQLDYLFHCFKQRGIYITLDLFCSRRFREGELADAPVRDGYAMKQLLSVYPPARENWKKFVRNLLSHRNPYTGLTWGEDPALFSVSLTNENITFGNWRGKAGKLYIDGYEQYLKERNLATPENLASRGGLFHRYLADLNIGMIRDLSGFVKGELGYKGLITELNFKQDAATAEIRDVLDFVDNHNYWDHPNSLPGRSWSFPFLHNQMSALKAAGWNPRVLLPSRIFGKAFTVTEINFVFPNRHRAEYGPLIGGYSALQDWDGLYRFSWAHDDQAVRHESPINRFDIAEDSLSQISERITNLLFVRGDVKPAASAVAWPFGESTFRGMNNLSDSAFPVDFTMLGFYCRIGTLREDKSFPGVRRLKDTRNFMNELTDAERRAVKEPVKRSEGGEITYDTAKGTMVIATPKTESVSLFGGALKGNRLAVSGATDTFQVVTVSAMDGRTLDGSGRILLFHQSDVTNRHIRYSSESMKAVEHWGKKAPLIRRAGADIALELPAGEYRVEAIGLDGVPKGAVKSDYSGGILRFRADTAMLGGTMVYLIGRK